MGHGADSVREGAITLLPGGLLGGEAGISGLGAKIGLGRRLGMALGAARRRFPGISPRPGLVGFLADFGRF